MPSEGSRGVKARFPITGVTSDGLCPDVRVKVVEDAKVHSKAKKRMMIEQTLYLLSYIFLAVNISIIKAWKSSMVISATTKSTFFWIKLSEKNSKQFKYKQEMFETVWDL